MFKVNIPLRENINQKVFVTRDKYGLYAVNFSDPMRRRTAKDSVYVISQIVRSKEIPVYLVPIEESEVEENVDRPSESTSDAVGRNECIFPLCVCFFTFLNYLYKLFVKTYLL